MANQVNDFVDNVHLNISNSFTHILLVDAENTVELNIIRCTPYISDELVIQSRENCKKWLEYCKSELSEFTCKI